MLQKKILFVKVLSLNLLLLLFSTFLFQTCSDDNPVSPPDENISASKLDTIINVDMSNVIVTYEDSVSILIPQGTVSGDTKLTITKLSVSSTPTDTEMEFPNAYEITLGDQHIFDKPLEITLKYDPAKLNEGKLKYKIGAAYYDETINKWALFKDVSVDTLQNTVSFNTTHLTKLSWYHFKYAYGYTDYLTSPHFIIYWTDGKVVSNTDYKSTLTNHKGSAPHYIQDILYYLEEARAVYENKKLTVPKDTTNKAEVRVLELPQGVDGNTSFFGFIRINQKIEKSNYFSQEELVKVTCAHELFHYVQDYYYLWFGAGNYIKWWLEATAVQTDRIVWPNKSKFEAIDYADDELAGQLERSWDDCNIDPNYYTAGGFLTYLTTYRDGSKLSIPEIIIESGKATNASYFSTILNTYVKNNFSSDGIGYEYRDYIRWAFEQKGPIKIVLIPPLDRNNFKWVIPVQLTETKPSWNGSGTVPYLAAKIVKIQSPTSTGATSFKIKLNSKDWTQSYLYITDKNKTKYIEYLSLTDNTLKIDLEKSQWIDILFTNSFLTREGIFNLSVELVQAPTITSITPSTASVGEVVKIIGNNFGVNQNSSEIWFGAIKALVTDIVSWIDTQIEVKVPEGAITGDVHIVAGGEKSNDVSFTVEGEPIITDIIDHLYKRDFQGIHRFTLPNNTAEIVGQNFGDYPPIRKVYVNNIEAEVYNWSDTLVQFKLPEQPTGNITVKLATSTGTSKEFSYFSGLPVSYLNSAEPVELNTGFHIKYFNARGNYNSTKYIHIQPAEFSKNKFSWGDRVLTVDLNSIENISGTVKYTFSEDGLSVEKVELYYSRSNEHPNEIVQYVGNNFPYYETNDWHGYETTFHSFRTCGEYLEQSTTTINGSVNYVDDLRADIDGIDYSAGCAFNSVYLKLNFTN